MAKVRWSWIVHALLACSAAAPLFFRFFVTVDGPVHVLHAAVLEQHWTTPRYVADGIEYDTHRLDAQLGDLILMALLRVCSPEAAHDGYAVLVSALLVMAMVTFLRAHGQRINAALLWVAPFLFSFILLMGFFHFVLGVGVALLAVAWYLFHRSTPRKAIAGLVGGFVLAWSTHRGAPALVIVIAATAMLTHRMMDGRAGIRTGRGWLGGAVVAALAVAALFSISTVITDVSQADMAAERGHRSLFLLRPLLMVDLSTELPIILVLGSVLLLSMIAAGWTRWRSGRTVTATDGWLVLALFFSVAPLLVETPKSGLLFIVERGQWLGALFLVMWLVAMLNAARGRPKWILVLLALPCIPLQFWRAMAVERTMAGLAAPHRSALAAVPYLGSGNVVVPVMTESNWLLQHLGAYVCIRHDGISFTRKEHLNFLLKDPPIPAVRDYLARMSKDRKWLPKHQRKGRRPFIDRILFIGGDPRQRALWLQPWKKMLDKSYIIGYDNGYATVYAFDRWGKKEEERRQRELLR